MVGGVCGQGCLSSAKHSHMLKELLSLNLALPTIPRLQVHRLSQIVAQLETDTKLLDPALVSGFLTAFHSELTDPCSVPELFAAISRTFNAMMSRSCMVGATTGLQLVHTLWVFSIKVSITATPLAVSSCCIGWFSAISTLWCRIHEHNMRHILVCMQFGYERNWLLYQILSLLYVSMDLRDHWYWE